MTLALDISNYTGPITQEQVNGWRDAGVGLVIVQAVDPPAAYPAGCTRQQLETLRDANMPAEAYVFFWFDASPDHIDRALSLLEGLPIRRVWLDVEDIGAKSYNQATTEAKVADALQRCDTWSQQQGLPQAGIYTGKWYWEATDYMGNTSSFSDRELWDANYDFTPDATSGFRPYGGWTGCSIKQHIGSSEFVGVGGLDQDCLTDEYAGAILGGSSPSSPQAPVATVTCPEVPQAYQEKFGVAADGWPAVAANLEGIIRQLIGEVAQVSQQEQSDAAKLEQVRALVARYRTGTLGKVRQLVQV